ncbi:MAG: hypothetical protein KIS92_20910 [Planctomycetota bacterium]|nr:hypothetical protein [Planctomycetota bacterium]
MKWMLCAWFAWGVFLSGPGTARAEEADAPASKTQEPSKAEEEAYAKRMEDLHIRMLEESHRGHVRKAEQTCLIGLGVLLAAAVAGLFVLRRWWARGLALAGLAAAGIAWFGYWSMLTF